MPWWIHRTLMGVLVLAGILASAYGLLWLPSLLKSSLGIRVGPWYTVVFVLGAVVLGGGIPWGIFRFLVPVKCPECGGRMRIERWTPPPRYAQQVQKAGTIYKCGQCGLEK